MDDQFVPGNLESRLLKLGFDRSKRITFIKGDDKENYKLYFSTPYQKDDLERKWVGGILWQQAFEFFLNRGYFADIKPDLIVTSFWSYKIVNINEKYNSDNLHNYKYTYYREARTACIEKLIEIVENEK